MVTVTAGSHRVSTCQLLAERWRLRDAAACIRPSLMFDVPLDAATGTPVSFGVVPLALGTAAGEHWRQQLAALGPDQLVPAFHRTERIRITYGEAVASIGAQLEIATVLEGRTLSSTVSVASGELARVDQVLADVPLVEEEPPVGGPADSAADELTRVRVARWVYISNENPTVHGNHVAATQAGLPAALVPASLFVGLAERLVFTDGPPRGRLTVDLTGPVYAGDCLTVRGQHLVSDRGAVVEIALG